MTLLITGATGLVGQELMRFVLQQGHKVNYLTTSKSKVKSQSNVNGFYWNPDTGEIDLKAFEAVEVIVHLAGATISKKWTPSYKEELLNSRVKSSQLLFSSLEKINHEVKQIISASAIGGYESSYDKIYHEDDPINEPEFLGEIVRKWEEHVDVFSKLGVKVTKVRIGIVLSKNGGAFVELIKPIKLGIGSALGTGNQYQSWIHIDDLISIFYYLISNQLEGVFNGVAPYPVTNKEMLRTMAKALHKPFFMPNVPTFVLKLILGEMHQIITSSQHVSCMKLLDRGFQFKYASLDKALLKLLQ